MIVIISKALQQAQQQMAVLFQVLDLAFQRKPPPAISFVVDLAI